MGGGGKREREEMKGKGERVFAERYKGGGGGVKEEG